MKKRHLLINKSSIHVEYLVLGGLLAVTGISGCVLRSTIVLADDDSVIDTVNITVPVSCTMSGNIDTAHNATLNNGTYSAATGSDYENGIGKTTLTTFCNDQNGFSIYAIGYTGDTAGNTNLIGTSASNNATIATGTATSGNISNWAMKVIKVDNPGGQDPDITYNPQNMTITNSFNNYHAVPDEYTKVAEYHATTGSSTTDTILGAKVETTYAAFISSTQMADTYSGQVKYVMVHPYNHATPVDEISFDDAYAAAGKQKLNGYYKMQDMSGSICSAVTLEDAASETTLIDSRDNKTYTVSKLKDGNCWMTQNLDHDISTNFSYSNENTDIGWNSSTNCYDTETWTPVASTHITNNTEWYEYNEIENPNGGNDFHAESYDPGELYVNPDMTAYYAGQEVEEPASATVSNVADSDPHFHLGNYYNWTAAVAMNDSSSYTTDGTIIEQSICPAGWTLPRAGTGEDTFAALWDNQAYGFDTINGLPINDENDNFQWNTGESALWTSPLYFALSGYYINNVGGWMDGVGDSGGFWSSVVSGEYSTYHAEFSINYLHANPALYGGVRDTGYSVRCVARPVVSYVSGTQ